jgi:hypothetical protein
METQEIKEFLKNKYPNYKGFIDHTLVSEMAKTFAEYYHNLQLKKIDILEMCCNSCGGIKIKLNNGFEKCQKCKKIFA